MGRPKKEIDWQKVDGYLKAQCDGASIARLLGMHPESFYRRVEETFKIGFTKYSQEKKDEGKELLRAKMYTEAMNGDKTMLIWLSKQYLGMKEKSEMDYTGTEIVINLKKGGKG